MTTVVISQCVDLDLLNVSQTTVISTNPTTRPTNEALTTTTPITPIGVTCPTGNHHVVPTENSREFLIVQYSIDRPDS